VTYQDAEVRAANAIRNEDGRSVDAMMHEDDREINVMTYCDENSQTAILVKYHNKDGRAANARTHANEDG
jgi:hypothetical protein